jgi:hypothetical protein
MLITTYSSAPFPLSGSCAADADHRMTREPRFAACRVVLRKRR